MNSRWFCLEKRTLTALILISFFISLNGWARQGDPPLSLTQPTPGSLDTVTMLSLPAIDQQRSLSEDAQIREPAPLRYAEPRTVSITPQNSGVWETLADGGQLWRQRVVCPGATDLNFGFSVYKLPEGARLYAISEGQNYYEGPYDASDNREHGQLWLPATPGDNSLIELYVPASVSADEVKLELTHVGCGYRNLFNQPNLQRALRQFACHIDVICPEGNQWRDQIRSVARYSIGGQGLCTGTLIRDVPGSFRNFFLTANHCEVTPANAPSVVVFWNYQSPACGQLSGGSLAQNQTGATFRASRFDVDMALIELSSNPSTSFNVFYSGWDRTGNVPAGTTGIHHPNGDEKAISSDDQSPITSNSCIGGETPNTHWQVSWNRGITEVGSSGSGLWEKTNKRLIGFLSGGESFCETPTAPDCYGKFSVAWDGANAASRLRDWLDPNSTQTTVVDGANPGAANSFALTVIKTGTGVGAVTSSPIGISCGSDCTESYASGTSIKLTATANAGSSFVGWSPTTCAASFAMPTSNLTCTATFNLTSQTVPSAVGVFRNGQWYLDANGNGAWDGCGTEFCFSGFGQAGDRPASGNWDGGTKSYIGVLRSDTGQWFTDRNGNRLWDGCVADGCYSGFGAPSDLPVAGDWNGRGFARIGVFRNGQWFLDDSGNGQWDGCSTDLCLNFGQAGDLPVAGNWDGGVPAGVGVFRAGTWYLDYNGNGAWDGCGVDRCYFNSFGQAGDLPAAGDWNGDGKAKVGVFRNGTWYLDYNGNGAWDGCGVDRCYSGSFGQQGDWPVAGKW